MCPGRVLVLFSTYRSGSFCVCPTCCSFSRTIFSSTLGDYWSPYLLLHSKHCFFLSLPIVLILKGPFWYCPPGLSVILLFVLSSRYFLSFALFAGSVFTFPLVVWQGVIDKLSFLLWGRLAGTLWSIRTPSPSRLPGCRPTPAGSERPGGFGSVHLLWLSVPFPFPFPPFPSPSLSLPFPLFPTPSLHLLFPQFFA